MHRTFKKTDISYDKSIIKNELLKEYGISKFSASSYELTGYVTDLTQEYSQVLMEYGATGKVTNVYSYAEGRVSAIIDGRSYSYLNDGRGSVSELTMTSGVTAVSYRYDIYGKTLASNKCINNPYQYNAEYTDSTTGLQYLRARYYNADTHRFQTKDTYQGNVAQPITRNNYAYANNNPVNFVDPSGHVGILAAWATKVAVSGAVGGVISGGISAYTQYKSTGDISWGKVAKDAAVGAVSSAVGAAVGNSIEKKIVGKVASKVLSFVGSGIASAVTGAAERGVSTALNNRLNPSTQRQNVLKSAFDPRSMATDFVVGGLSYSVADLYSMYRNGTLKGDLYEMVADFYQNNPGCSDDMARVVEQTVETISQKEISSKIRPDFYVTPSGDALPSTGYRYVSENAPYLTDMANSMSIPANSNGTYFSFDNYDVANPGALQVPHDASIKISFDTLQIVDDIRIPYGQWGNASYLEPITNDFPQYGAGGATQVVTNSEIQIDKITKLPKG